jgi:hypothetical protein
MYSSLALKHLFGYFCLPRRESRNKWKVKAQEGKALSSVTFSGSSEMLVFRKLGKNKGGKMSHPPRDRKMRREERPFGRRKWDYFLLSSGKVNKEQKVSVSQRTSVSSTPPEDGWKVISPELWTRL